MIKENYEFLFSLLEDSDRFEDMRQHLSYCLSKELSLVERNSFYNCYKKIISARRNVWHPVYILEKKEEAKQKVISWYRNRLEEEMDGICREVESVCDFQIKTCKESEQRCFFFKMKGDYFRYEAEYQAISENKEKYGLRAVQGAFLAYEQASEIALSEFAPTNPLRLSLGLNFSVFFYEIMKNKDRALLIARMAHQDGINDLVNVDGHMKKECEKIIGMINENIILWSNEA
jgi:14-3-3 protein epsilon